MIADQQTPHTPEAAEDLTADSASTSPESPQSTAQPRHSYRPKGKIASLPKAQRDTISGMLVDGSTYAAIIRTMAEQGVSLNAENVSNWANGPGHQRYIKDLEWKEDMR